MIQCRVIVRLGSVVTLTNHNNLIMEHRSYDPFGKPRYGTMQASPSATLFNVANGTPFTMRGFTDHEHIDEAQLIHMNGRVYDYNLGRFLSVDPFIQEPGNSQSLNPYSYIMNNPLAGTDPSGYLSCQADQTVGECGLEAGDTAEIVDKDGNSLGTASLSEDGKTLKAEGNNGINSATTALNGKAFTVDVKNTSQIGAQTSLGDGTGEPDKVRDDVRTRLDLEPNSDQLSLEGDKLILSLNVYNTDNSGLSDEHVDKELASISSAYSGKVNGKGELKLTLIRVSDPQDADLTIDICGYDCRKELEGKAIPEGTRAFVLGIGSGSHIYRTYKYLPGNQTLAHEVGHYLGLYHQRNETGSIMSYSDDRKVKHSDRERLYDAYKSLF